MNGSFLQGRSPWSYEDPFHSEGQVVWGHSSNYEVFSLRPHRDSHGVLCSEFWKKIMCCLGFTGLLEARMVFSLGNILNRISEQEEITCETQSTV